MFLALYLRNGRYFNADVNGCTFRVVVSSNIIKVMGRT